MKIVLEREEVDKIIMDYLQLHGKIEKDKNISVIWTLSKDIFNKSTISVEVKQ